MTATVYSQWQVPLAPTGRHIGVAPVRRPMRAVQVQWASASAAGMGFSRARRAARRRRLALAAGDVCMVLAWAAMIPGLMWLGAAAGF